MKRMKTMLAMLLVLAITVAFAPVTSAAERAEIVMDFCIKSVDIFSRN